MLKIVTHKIFILLHIIPTRYTIHRVYFYLTTALHVSGVTITHRQEHKTTVTIASGNRYTVLLSVAIVEESEMIYSLIAIKLATCFDPTGSSSGLHNEPIKL